MDKFCRHIIIVLFALVNLDSSLALGYTKSPSQKQSSDDTAAFYLDNIAKPTVSDSLEKMNRITFRFNDTLDKYVSKPLAKFYNRITPRWLNKGIHYFVLNLDNPTLIMNDLLQANFYEAVSDGWRLLVNSTVGIVGFFDVASHIGLPVHSTDFGITLEKWGYSQSTYLVLPVLGPSSIRDICAIPVDYWASIYPWIPNIVERNGLIGFTKLDQRSQLLRFEKVYESAALDPYIFERNAYLQHRQYLTQRSLQLDNPYTTSEMHHDIDDYYLDE